MRILWDEPKRLANLVKHGMDFASLDLDFFARAAIGRAKDGRLIAVGELNGIITVIFIMLGTEALSVISMRPASIKERRGL
ncbi:BrnT family toxin [Bosea sp. 685]|nr:BrnT family toxin [Bosea sp. 685]WNJ93870.1 BrnT family toxin [Bosea sp. 685]